MKLATPKIAVLDSATLGKVSRDYWSKKQASKDKARAFLAQLLERGVFIAFALTHICELLRHDNVEVVQDRIRFLRSIRLIAWLRPYDRTWFPGCITDLLARELHTVHYCSANSGREIIQKVRPELWETGVGSEMFVENGQLWSVIRNESKRQHERELYVASISRTNPGGLSNVKLRDLQKLPKRPKSERNAFAKRLAREMKGQLDQHGDERLAMTGQIANDFANETVKDLQTIDSIGGDPFQRILESHGVPMELMGPETTVGEVGELAIYARRLRALGQRLKPPCEIQMKDVPVDTLPSYVLERKLASFQSHADRVSGSDLGDSHLIPLVFYADGVEVDKRTFHHLKQLRHVNSKLAELMGPFFRSSDYMEIPKHFE